MVNFPQIWNGVRAECPNAGRGHAEIYDVCLGSKTTVKLRLNSGSHHMKTCQQLHRRYAELYVTE